MNVEARQGRTYTLDHHEEVDQTLWSYLFMVIRFEDSCR